MAARNFGYTTCIRRTRGRPRDLGYTTVDQCVSGGREGRPRLRIHNVYPANERASPRTRIHNGRPMCIRRTRGRPRELGYTTVDQCVSGGREGHPRLRIHNVYPADERASPRTRIHNVYPADERASPRLRIHNGRPLCIPCTRGPPATSDTQRVSGGREAPPAKSDTQRSTHVYPDAPGIADRRGYTMVDRLSGCPAVRLSGYRLSACEVAARRRVAVVGLGGSSVRRRVGPIAVGGSSAGVAPRSVAPAAAGKRAGHGRPVCIPMRRGHLVVVDTQWSTGCKDVRGEGKKKKRRREKRRGRVRERKKKE